MAKNDQKASNEKYSHIFIREKYESKKVKIGSDSKPEVTASVLKKWQSLLDTLAKIAAVPSSLIMRLNEDSIEVFLKSETEGNPYEKGEEARLVYGLYCETVIGTQEKLLVPNATKSKVWKDNNPDVDINMISYLGFPINWPDGEVFGTVCLLDSKENNFNEDFSNLLQQVKQHIETDLEQLVIKQKLEEKNKELEQMNETKSRFLSLISHDIRGGIGVLDEFLRIIIENLDNYDNTKIRTMLKTLSERAGYSFQMLDNLLNWTKNDMVELHADKTYFDVVKQIENLLDYFKQSLSLKKIIIDKNFSDEKMRIHADKRMIKASLRNILSNAIKYTPNGGRIMIKTRGKNNRQIIYIEDTGIGMNEKQLEKLFTYNDAYTKHGTNGEESSGIGLMLTKEFLDKNEAQVKVKSVLGKGTCFKISFNT